VPVTAADGNGKEGAYYLISHTSPVLTVATLSAGVRAAAAAAAAAANVDVLPFWFDRSSRRRSSLFLHLRRRRRRSAISCSRGGGAIGWTQKFGCLSGNAIGPTGN